MTWPSHIWPPQHPTFGCVPSIDFGALEARSIDPRCPRRFVHAQSSRHRVNPPTPKDNMTAHARITEETQRIDALLRQLAVLVDREGVNAVERQQGVGVAQLLARWPRILEGLDWFAAECKRRGETVDAQANSIRRAEDKISQLQQALLDRGAELVELSKARDVHALEAKRMEHNFNSVREAAEHAYETRDAALREVAELLRKTSTTNDLERCRDLLREARHELAQLRNAMPYNIGDVLCDAQGDNKQRYTVTSYALRIRYADLPNAHSFNADLDSVKRAPAEPPAPKWIPVGANAARLYHVEGCRVRRSTWVAGAYLEFGRLIVPKGLVASTSPAGDTRDLMELVALRELAVSTIKDGWEYSPLPEAK